MSPLSLKWIHLTTNWCEILTLGNAIISIIYAIINDVAEVAGSVPTWNLENLFSRSFTRCQACNHIYFIFRACAFNGLPSLINILPLSFFAPNRYQRNYRKHTWRTKQHIQNIRQTDAREQFISVSRF